MKKKYKVSLYSEDWLESDVFGVTRWFTGSGFRDTEEILSMKVYDLLNISKIDSGKAGEMILALYMRFNRNSAVDEDMELGFVSQYLLFREWKKEHGKVSEIRVKDIVLTEQMNRKAVISFYESIVRAFYRSSEYLRREYLYSDYSDWRKRQ